MKAEKPWKIFSRRCSALLGKLIKNEMKASLHSVALVYVAAVGALAAVAFSLVFKIMWLTALALIAIVAVAIGILLITIVSIISGFNRSLFRDQGYLTFTLPLTSGQILLAKSLCSFIWLVISFLSVIFIYGAVFSMTFARARDQMGEENIAMARELINAFVKLPDKEAVVTAIIAIASRIFLLIVFAIALVFFSITLSNVRPFQRQGFLPAVLIFVVMFVVTQLISTLLNIYVPLSVSVSLSEGLQLQTTVALNTLLNFGVADVIFQLAVTCFFFGFSAWLMNHKINLK